MDKIYAWFPLSASALPGNARRLVVTLLIYLAALGLMQVLSLILGWIPLIGWLLNLLFSLIGIYCVAGLVFAIFRFCGH